MSGSKRGGFRWTDPSTSIESAMTVNVGALEYAVLRVLSVATIPINGWEIAETLGWSTISAVPRLAPLRRKNMIEIQGTRPGPPPKFKSQLAYVITPRGLAFLAFVQGR